MLYSPWLAFRSGGTIRARIQMLLEFPRGIFLSFLLGVSFPDKSLGSNRDSGTEFQMSSCQFLCDSLFYEYTNGLTTILANDQALTVRITSFSG
jgi:hypothetical protein